MNAFTILFHLAAIADPTFLGGADDDMLLTMEANKLLWPLVPEPGGDKTSFATGYVMGRERMDRDPNLPEGLNLDYDLGYERGLKVTGGSPRPQWDRGESLN
jgi:hypothetical protein